MRFNPVEFTICTVAAGIDRVTWCSEPGGLTTLILAIASEAETSNLQLADIVVWPNQATRISAEALAETTMHEFPCCRVVVVEVHGDGYLLHRRHNDGTVDKELVADFEESATGPVPLAVRAFVDVIAIRKQSRPSAGASGSPWWIRAAGHGPNRRSLW
jgi:hypothetical protein